MKVRFAGQKTKGGLKWIDKDPFLGYRLKSKPAERPYLSEDELQRIADKKFQ